MDALILLLLIGIGLVSAALIYRQLRPQKPAAAPPVAAEPRNAPRLQLRQRGLRRRDAPVDDAAEGEEEEEEGEDFVNQKKVGAKKAKSLAEKAARKQANEARLLAQKEAEERERLRQEEEQRQQRLEQDKESRAKAEEDRKKEEEAKKLQQEYEALKSMFVVEEAGAQADEIEQESQGLLAEFVEFIKRRKVVPYEDLATQFGLKTQEAINRVQALEKMGRITGVEDDRGKFIYIAQEELENVARFIRQRGRVSIEELAEASSELVQLQGEAPAIPPAAEQVAVQG